MKTFKQFLNEVRLSQDEVRKLVAELKHKDADKNALAKKYKVSLSTINKHMADDQLRRKQSENILDVYKKRSPEDTAKAKAEQDAFVKSLRDAREKKEKETPETPEQKRLETAHMQANEKNKLLQRAKIDASKKLDAYMISKDTNKDRDWDKLEQKLKNDRNYIKLKGDLEQVENDIKSNFRVINKTGKAYYSSRGEKYRDH